MPRKTIEICCYNSIELWHSRQRAIQFYRECMTGSEGSEKERYSNILFDLYAGKSVCLDDTDRRVYEYCKQNGKYKQFKNGSNIRDLDGTVSFPI